MNTLIITYLHDGAIKSIPISECAHIIPRLGEEVYMNGSYPKVTRVTYEYDDGIIYVIVEDV